MKRLFFICLSALAIVLTSGCADKHFITDEQYRAQVEADFAARESIMEASGIDLDAMGLTAVALKYSEIEKLTLSGLRIGF